MGINKVDSRPSPAGRDSRRAVTFSESADVGQSDERNPTCESQPGPLRAVFLDRDGVINQAIIKNGSPYPPSTLSKLVILPGVYEALVLLRSAGFRLIVVTNQPDVARGTQTREAVEEMNAWLKSKLPLDELRVCYHDDSAGCSCRKPAPGLLLDAARDSGLDLSASYMIGDRWRDIEAGRRAGCKSIFIDYCYDERQPDSPDLRVSNLIEASWKILGIDDRESEEATALGRFKR